MCFGAFTRWLVGVLGLELVDVVRLDRRKPCGLGEGHTAPVVVFSWVLFPLTLKATPLAVVLLTSRVAAEVW